VQHCALCNNNCNNRVCTSIICLSPSQCTTLSFLLPNNTHNKLTKYLEKQSTKCSTQYYEKQSTQCSTKYRFNYLHNRCYISLSGLPIVILFFTVLGFTVCTFLRCYAHIPYHHHCPLPQHLHHHYHYHYHLRLRHHHI